MRIDKLTLRNFRCFDERLFNLDEHDASATTTQAGRSTVAPCEAADRAHARRWDRYLDAALLGPPPNVAPAPRR
jgi:hypothetical protein